MSLIYIFILLASYVWKTVIVMWLRCAGTDNTFYKVVFPCSAFYRDFNHVNEIACHILTFLLCVSSQKTLLTPLGDIASQHTCF